jgi:hypothetical protein
MLIQEDALKHWIDHFYGYGSWHAKIWFIAFEESGGDLPEDVAERTDYFLKAQPQQQPALCDIRDLYRHVQARLEGPRAQKFSTLYDHRFGKHAVIHGGWKNLIEFSFGLQDKMLPDLAAYQKEKFVLPAAQQEALITLYPLPAPHNHAWYYSWLDMPQFSFLKNRKLYQGTLYKSRIETILRNMRTYKPCVVMMFGMSAITSLKRSVQDFFPGSSFKTTNAEKLLTPQHHIADLGQTKLIITTQVPTLRHNRVETGYDWNFFGKQISGNGY